MSSATRTQSPAPRRTGEKGTETAESSNGSTAKKRFLCFRWLSDEGIRQVAKFKFTPATYTPLDNLMNPFWLKCQSFVPRWISPNAVTLFGGFCSLLSTLIAIYAGSRSWLYFVSSFLFFCYQTADAVDGKHARLTGQTTPLGGLVDHGMDAFVALLIGLTIISLVEPRLESWWIFFGFNTFLSAWAVGQWEHFETGVLQTVGVTELELFVAALLMLPGIFGDDMFSSDVSLLGKTMGLRLITCLCIGGGCSMGMLAGIGRTLWKTRRLSSLVSLTTVVLQNAFSALLFSAAPASAYPLLKMMVIGMDSCAVNTRMVISGITHEKWPTVHIAAIPFILVSVLAGAGLSMPTWVLFALLSWQMLTFVFECEDVIRRICCELNIPFIGEVPRKDA